MFKLLFTVFCLMACATGAIAQTADLLISEYVEGSGNNKAIEIFNGTEDVINLGGYTLNKYANGGTVPTVIILTAVDLQSGDTFVIGNPFADPALLAYLDQTHPDINFNGDDALALFFGGTVMIDSFGTIGEDPGSFWSCLDGNTANHSMRRRSGVCTGDLVGSDLFDPCTEWTFAASDVFTDLGQQTVDCGTVATDYTDWGHVKALYR